MSCCQPSSSPASPGAVAPARLPGRVDDDVDACAPLRHGRRDALGVLRPREVGAQPANAELVRRLREHVLAPPEDNHVLAVSGEGGGDGPSDARPAARDDDRPRHGDTGRPVSAER
jgi:hypothetical protein